MYACVRHPTPAFSLAHNLACHRDGGRKLSKPCALRGLGCNVRVSGAHAARRTAAGTARTPPHVQPVVANGTPPPNSVVEQESEVQRVRPHRGRVCREGGEALSIATTAAARRARDGGAGVAGGGRAAAGNGTALCGGSLLDLGHGNTCEAGSDLACRVDFSEQHDVFTAQYVRTELLVTATKIATRWRSVAVSGSVAATGRAGGRGRKPSAVLAVRCVCVCGT